MPPALLALALALALAACSPADSGDSGPVLPSLSTEDGVAVLQVGGTAWDMGFQQGTLLRDRILEGGAWVEESEFRVAEGIAAYNGLLDLAREASLPEVVDECRGMAEAVDDPLWTEDRCLLLAFGDVVMESLEAEWTRCSQFVATGAATADGRTVHGRNLDWSDIPFIIDNPTLIVRHPDGGIPWVAVGFPGNVSPYSGMNAEGLALLSDDATGVTPPDLSGRSHNQMMVRFLETLSTVDEAWSAFEAEDHTSAEIVVASDAAGGGAVFELATDGLARRSLSGDGVVWATNHFVDPATDPLDEEPGSSSLARYLRLEQLLQPGGEGSLYGTYSPQVAVGVLRDTTDPVSGETCDPATFDGCDTLANNANLQSMVLAPGERLLWLAAGPVPVPRNAYVGFRVDGLLGDGGGVRADPTLLE